MQLDVLRSDEHGPARFEHDQSAVDLAHDVGH